MGLDWLLSGYPGRWPGLTGVGRAVGAHARRGDDSIGTEIGSPVLTNQSSRRREISPWFQSQLGGVKQR
jgi:hypothetical protein